jgi:hypothetical protein
LKLPLPKEIWNVLLRFIARLSKKTTMLCGCGPVFNKIMGQVIKKEDSHTVIQSDV